MKAAQHRLPPCVQFVRELYQFQITKVVKKIETFDVRTLVQQTLRIYKLEIASW